MSNRQGRELETRDQTARKKMWQPADLLPNPTPVEGYEFRYVRKSMMGQDDPTNTSRSFREGWEPCRLEDHPELRLSIDPGTENSGMVEIGGLILCKMPEEMVAQRRAHYRQRSEAAEESVDAALMRENDSRMPLFKERKSSVSFGRGN
jgi:hypothetical protein